MTARQHKGYHERRTKLVEAMGNRCSNCLWFSAKLEFDHIDPSRRTWVVRNTGRLKRIALYEKEFEAGLLQLLCRTCNARKSAISTNYKKRMRILDSLST